MSCGFGIHVELLKPKMALRDYLFYEEPGITLYCGDCLEVLPFLEEIETVITDPIWPNAHPDFLAREDTSYPARLFNKMLARLPCSVERLIVWLGCQSDPRFLTEVPVRFPFLRMAYLRRAVPSYNGRCLVSGDVIYAFGQWPDSREGGRVIPGECSVTSIPSLREAHPAARNEGHARWVVKWWGQGLILDPFAGTGTTLVACKAQGVAAVGIEIEPKYCEIAVKRLRQGVLLL